MNTANGNNSPRRASRERVVNASDYISTAMHIAGVAIIASPPRRHSQENDAALENGGGPMQEIYDADIQAILGEFGQSNYEVSDYQLPDCFRELINVNPVGSSQEIIANDGVLDLPALEEPTLNEPCTSKADTSNASPKDEEKSVRRSGHVSSDDSDFEQTSKRAPLKLKIKKTTDGHLKAGATPGPSSRREVKTKKTAANDNVVAAPSLTTAGPSTSYQIMPITFAPRSQTKTPTLKALLTAEGPLPGASNKGAEKTSVTKSRVTKRSSVATPNKAKGKAPLRKRTVAANVTAEVTASPAVVLDEGVRSKSPVADPVPIQGSDSESEFEFFSQSSDRVLFKNLKKRCRNFGGESEAVDQALREAREAVASLEEDFRVADDALRDSDAQASKVAAEILRLQKKLQGIEEERQRREDRRANVATNLERARETLRLRERDSDRVLKKRKVRDMFERLMDELGGKKK